MPLTPQPDQQEPRKSLIQRFHDIRKLSLQICEPLEPEDYNVQSMSDTSPPKWHLAHTSWFFETFILVPYLRNYQLFHPKFPFLFNSYYQSVGCFHPRPERGNLARPTYQTVFRYRQQVNEAVTELVDKMSENQASDILRLMEIGLNHEQQHQELMLMDIKYNFYKNPLYPNYLNQELYEPQRTETPNLGWLPLNEGVYTIGAPIDGFSYDNERHQHKVMIEAGDIADRLITNHEYLSFIEDGGYQKADYWLAEGWDWIQREKVNAPLYWIKDQSQWFEFTLYGLQALNPSTPVIHISYYEAEAFARWRGCRLPREQEWEAFAQKLPSDQGQFLHLQTLHPLPKDSKSMAHQFFGSAWEWTSSAYAAYPGFRPVQGALGEYNGKFMCNQYVLRGGACVTPEGHIRASYRNFFPAWSRWMFSGIRLMKGD